MTGRGLGSVAATLREADRAATSVHPWADHGAVEVSLPIGALPRTVDLPRTATVQPDCDCDIEPSAAGPGRLDPAPGMA